MPSFDDFKRAGYVQLDAPLRNITRREGATVHIRCEITGFPLPRYTWSRDLHPINGRGRGGWGQGGRLDIKTTPWGSRCDYFNARN